MSEIETKWRGIVAEHLGLEADTITERASLLDDLGADSLDMVELVIAAEVEFDIEIDDDEMNALNTFGDFVQLIEKHSR